MPSSATVLADPARQTAWPAPRPLAGLGLIVIAAALWATVGVAVGMRQGETALDAGFTGFARTLIGAVALLGFALVTGRFRAAARLPIRPLLAFGTGVALFQIGLFAAFAEVGVTITVAVTVCLPPLFVAAFDAVRARSLPGRRTRAAFLIAAAGVLLIVIPGGGLGATRAVGLYGSGLLIGAALAFSVVAIAARSLCRRSDPILGTGLGLGVAAALLAVACSLDGSLQATSLAALDAGDLALLLYLGLAATGGAYLAFSIGLRLCPSSTGGLVASMIEPAIAAMLAMAILGERLRDTDLLGCAAFLVAVILISATEVLPQRPCTPA